MALSPAVVVFMFVGAALVAVGGLGASWIAPQLAVGSHCIPVGTFSVTASGFNGVATDTSTTCPGDTLGYDSVNWGDGATTQMSYHGSTQHLYPAVPDTYTVAVVFHWTICVQSTCGPSTTGATHVLSVGGGLPANGMLRPGWIFSVNGLSLSVTDTTQAVNATLTSVAFQWGDGTSSSVSPGGSFTHTYASNGTFNVTEVDKGTSNNGVSVGGSFSAPVDMSTGGGGCVGLQCGGGGPPPSVPSTTNYALLASGAALLVGSVFIIASPRPLVIAIVALVSAALFPLTLLLGQTGWV